MPSVSLQFRSVLFGPAGFSEEYFTSSPGDPHRAPFDTFASRRGRYDVYWSHYEGNAYRKIHRFAESIRKEYDLYPSIRTVLSPAYRIVEFWAEHLLGGLLDPDAGDGVEKPSAIPILTESPRADELRAAIGQLWRDSNWQIAKDNWTRFGAALGDVGLLPFDDPARQKVFLRVIHPSIVREVDLDPQRNCKGYVFEEWRPDPRELDISLHPRLVKYNEYAERVGRGRVRFLTTLDDEPYDWRDYPYEDSPKVGAEWTEDYGFVPFVWHQHRDMGLGAGWSELHPSFSRLHELDDLASKIVDQVRKSVDCPWLIVGIDDIGNLKVTYGTDAEGGTDNAQRDQTPIFTCDDPAARPWSLVGTLDLNAAAAQAQTILDQIEKNHPELIADDANVSGSASGRARRVARERIEARVAARRAGYDNALTRAQNMAISMAAGKRYPGYEAFDKDSFSRGELDHAIGDRPVFAVDTMDHLEEAQSRAMVLASLVASGVPVEVAMGIAGFTPEAIEATEAAAARALAVAEDRTKRLREQFGGDQIGDGEDGDGAPDHLFQLNGVS